MTPDWKTLARAPSTLALLQLALDEDIGSGDVTTQAIFPKAKEVEAIWLAKTPTVVAGVDLVAVVFEEVAKRIGVAADFQVLSCHTNGTQVQKGEAILRARTDIRVLLTAERTALNFMMRLCGVANAAWAAAKAVPSDCKAKIYDTRKTTPGWRALEKAAVLNGGACNHRMGLYDAVLIKDNHVAAAGSVTKAVQVARAASALPIEVEVDSLEQLREAIEVQPQIILLDNFVIDDMVRAVQIVGGRIPLEVSGGVTLERIAAIARTGVERISIGAITHSAMPADISLEVVG